MSESDDCDLLAADIQALDEALALDVKRKSWPTYTEQHSDISSSSDLENPEDNDDCFEYLYANQHIDESLNAYEINTRLITGLSIAKRKLTVLLEECEQKIKLLDEKMASRDTSSTSSKYALSNAGMPYFKDKDYFSPPQNYDTKIKEARGELLFLSLKKPSRWSRKDRDTLNNAIKSQAYESLLSEDFNKNTNASTSNNQIKKIKVLPKTLREMVGAIGEKEFDWHKISAMDFDNKHSPGECRAMWNVYLHPDIEKNEWTSAEDNKLLKCAKEHNYQDWDAITKKLNTNRSAYQCFIRYNTIKRVPCSGRIWTKEEDKHLMKIMNAIKLGDYIPWTEISNHMRHRTKQQIYVRWMYSQAPHLKKGRFTKAETSILLKAVQKYGRNFCKISSLVMPNRTSVQLQLRYDTVMTNIKNSNLNLWTVNDDTTLINLHAKYKNNWSAIATHFPGKSRTQVRHRHHALAKYVMKGVSLESIPRPPPTIPNRRLLMNRKFLSSSKYRNIFVAPKKSVRDTVSVYEIQLRLYETLCFPPSMPNNFEKEPYDIEQLALNTKKLHDTLNLLNANLNISSDCLNYAHLNSREKQILDSLKDCMNVENNGTQNSELIEQFRTRMFGNIAKSSKSDFFIPPLPFNGYVKLKKTKTQNTSTNYDLDANEAFLIDMPTEFSNSPGILDFVSIDEEIQFQKFSQFLINDYHNWNQQNVNLYKSLNCVFLLKKEESIAIETVLEDNEQNINLEDYEQLELNKLTETVNINEPKEADRSNLILPNRASLMGLKNLFVWKLLYDYQDETRKQGESIASCHGFGNDLASKQTTNSQEPVTTKSAEYQLLRTRLLQLFKLPISLSNTILQTQGPETIFSIKEKSPEQNVDTKKRKLEDTEPVQKNKKINSNVTTDNSFCLDVTETENIPTTRRSLRQRHKLSQNNV
ncbi:uncharacterized protein LOC105205738 [Solenopsis invicta]|uniref:uncharacterized protein LOC105205738 n=1 Tax=Solenopsis invicta TaxID=13686 RepID=UPI0001FECC62|nr:uncharacterized protein LOC105205738 [Solenopsis invicta]